MTIISFAIMSRLLVLFSFLLLEHSSAFSPNVPILSNQIADKTTLFMSDEPSDTSSDPFYADDAVTVESEEVVPTESGDMASSVLDMIPTTLGEMSESDRSAINEALLKLEALNPTKEPAMSSLLNGEWELRYAGGYSSEGALASPTRQLALFLYSGGYSPGLFALSLAQKLPSSLVSVGDLKIEIFEYEPRVQASIDVTSPFGESSVLVKATLKAESDIRLRETYESAEVMVSKNSI